METPTTEQKQARILRLEKHVEKLKTVLEIRNTRQFAAGYCWAIHDEDILFQIAILRNYNLKELLNDLENLITTLKA